MYYVLMYYKDLDFDKTKTSVRDFKTNKKSIPESMSEAKQF